MTHEEQLLLGKRLRSCREALGFTQEAAASQIGISLRFYQMIERGEKGVSLDTLIQISKTLKVSMDYLLLGDLANSLKDPVAEAVRNLSLAHREDAVKILTMYAKACRDPGDL